MTNEELQEIARQVILNVIEDADKRTVWELAQQGVIDQVDNREDVSRIVDLVHRARVTVTF